MFQERQRRERETDGTRERSAISSAENIEGRGGLKGREHLINQKGEGGGYTGKMITKMRE